MSNQLLVLAHKRGECLWLCLESLRRCRGIENYPLCLAINQNSSAEIPDIARKLWEGLDLELHVMPAEWLSIQSYSEALKYAFSKSDDLIVVVEEDQEVSRDFLEFVEYGAVNLRNERLLSVIGMGQAIPRAYTVGDNEVLWVTNRFAMRGYLLLKEPFQRYIEPYLCEDFYKSEGITETGHPDYNPAFIDNAFPEQERGIFSLDGLIDKVVRKFGLYTLISVVPRCHVIGFYGLHTTGVTQEAMELFLSKSLEDRVTFMKGAVATGAIQDFFGSFASEYWPIADDHKWSELRVRSEGMY